MGCTQSNSVSIGSEKEPMPESAAPVNNTRLMIPNQLLKSHIGVNSTDFTQAELENIRSTWNMLEDKQNFFTTAMVR